MEVFNTDVAIFITESFGISERSMTGEVLDRIYESLQYDIGFDANISEVLELEDYWYQVPGDSDYVHYSEYIGENFTAPFGDLINLRGNVKRLQSSITSSLGSSGLTLVDTVASNVKKKAGNKYMTIQFVVSDGQTITMFFHDPTKTGKADLIGQKTRLVCYDARLNKQRITAAIVKSTGRQLSIKQTGDILAGLVNKNKTKWAEKQEKRDVANEEIKQANLILNNTNAAVTEIKNELETLDKQEDQFKDEKSQLQSSIETKKARLAEIQAEIDALNKNKGAEGLTPGDVGANGEGKPGAEILDPEIKAKAKDVMNLTKEDIKKAVSGALLQLKEKYVFTAGIRVNMKKAGGFSSVRVELKVVKGTTSVAKLLKREIEDVVKQTTDLLNLDSSKNKVEFSKDLSAIISRNDKSGSELSYQYSKIIDRDMPERIKQAGLEGLFEDQNDWYSAFRKFIENEYDKNKRYENEEDAWQAFVSTLEKPSKPDTLYDWFAQAKHDNILDDTEILGVETALIVLDDKNEMRGLERLRDWEFNIFSAKGRLNQREDIPQLVKEEMENAHKKIQMTVTKLADSEEPDAVSSGIWEKTIAEIQQYEPEEIQAFYDELENANYHSHLTLLLAKYVGSPKDIADAEQILARWESDGELTEENNTARSTLYRKLWEVFRQRLNLESNLEPELLEDDPDVEEAINTAYAILEGEHDGDLDNLPVIADLVYNNKEGIEAAGEGDLVQQVSDYVDAKLKPDLEKPWQNKNWAKEQAIPFINDELLPGKVDLTDEDKEALRGQFERLLEMANKKLSTYMPLEVEEWFEKQKTAMENGLKYLETSPEEPETPEEPEIPSESPELASAKVTANDILEGIYDDDPDKVESLIEEIIDVLDESDPDLLDQVLEHNTELLTALA